MASQLNTPARPHPTGTSSVRATKVSTYVNHQLEKTRRQVKSTDLLSGLLTVFAIALGILLLAAVWDAWIWPLTTTGRWVCLGLLIASCLLYALLGILPLLIRKINPDYAAKMIEESKPSFKNSILNYVSLRNKNEGINPAVFDAISRQAATDLSSVPADATVDRSKLIRLGFVLIGLTLFGVGYKMLSPKDPLQTFGRVLAPIAKIAQPAIVRISEIEPGDTKIFFGDRVEVTAVVRGRHQPEDVHIEYSTQDGQLTNQRIAMQPTNVASRYRGELAIGAAGIQQSLNYRIVARDGVSPDFEVVVQANPTIAVEAIKLTPPAYTKIAEQTLVGQGNVEAIEGTNVVVQAIANLPIQQATIELLQANEPLAGSRDEATNAHTYRVVRRIEMLAAGKSATAGFLALLNASRQKPFATHYRLTFVSTDGDRNLKPNVYPIKIIPDLAPEIEISHPQFTEITIAENGILPIAIEAHDLDFEISTVTLNLDHQGSKLLNRNLPLQSNNGNRRVTTQYQLKPTDFRLRAGDKAIFFATASDNRTAPENGTQPDPNISRSENFTITITAPENTPSQDQQQPNQNGKTENESQESESDEGGSQPKEQQGEAGDQDDGETTDDSPQSGNSGGSGDSGDEGEPGDSSSGQSSSESSQSNQSSGDPNGGSQQENEPNQDQGASPNDQNQDPNGNGNSSQQENSQQSPKDAGDSGSSGGSQSSSEGNAQANADQQNGSDSGAQPNSDSEIPTAGQSNSGADQNTASNDATDDGGKNQNPASDGAQRGAQSPSNSNDSSPDSGRQDENLTQGEREPLSKDASPGEQIRRLKQLLEEQEKQNGGSSGADQNQSDQNSADRRNTSQPNSEGNQAKDQANDQANDQAQPDSESARSDQQNSNGAQQPEPNNDQPGSPDSQTTDSQKPKPTGNSDSGDAKSENTESGDSKSGDSKSGDSKSGDSKSGDSKSGDSKSGDSPMGDAPNAEDASSNEPSSGDSQSDKSQSGDSKSADSEAADSESGDSKSGDAAGENPSQSSPQNQSESTDSASGGANNEPPPGAGQSGDSSSGGASDSDSSQQKSTDRSQADESNNANSSPPDNTTQSVRGTGGGGGSLSSHEIENEAANREHSMKATDLILNRLNEQKYDPDPKLLEEMNWTQDDLNSFLDRWQQMKKAAGSGDPQAAKAYERSLKSLGLGPNQDQRAVRQNTDQIEGMSVDGAVIQPPPELAPDFNATLRDLNR